MPRHARKISSTGIYHLIIRGINKEPIFLEDEDRHRFLETLLRISVDTNATILGYCLMDNHVHLLIREGTNSISNLMHRLNASYAYYFNWKYERSGHVFQNRFKSENVEDEAYLMAVLRYIHNNPVKAGMIYKPEVYQWSSCKVYYGGKDYLAGLTDKELVLGLFSDNTKEAVKEFRKFSEMETIDVCMTYTAETKLSDAKALQVIKEVLGEMPLDKLKEMHIAERNAILQKLKSIKGLSIRQIARLTGVGVNIVKRA